MAKPSPLAVSRARTTVPPPDLRSHLLDGHYLEGARLAHLTDLPQEHRYEHRRDRLAGIEDHTHEDMDLVGTLPVRPRDPEEE